MYCPLFYRYLTPETKVENLGNKNAGSTRMTTRIFICNNQFVSELFLTLFDESTSQPVKKTCVFALPPKYFLADFIGIGKREVEHLFGTGGQCRECCRIAFLTPNNAYML